MRVLFGCIAVVLGAISITLAARYGFKGADTLVDGTIAAVMFGAIALCAFLFDGAAVRLWLHGHRLGAVVIGLIATLALVVTFTNSLGAIAARGDATLAERTKAVDTRKEDKAELARLSAERTAMAFTPATAEAVSAAKEAVKSAERAREAECGDGDPKQRGKVCQSREVAEEAARTKLSTAVASKDATDRAAKLDADIAILRKRLDGGQAVADANPLGAVLGIMLGVGTATVTAWQQAVMAAVFELCLVGMMIAFELLGEGEAPAGRSASHRAEKADIATAARADVVEPVRTPDATIIEPEPCRTALPPPRKPRAKTPPKSNTVKTFLRDHLFPAEDGERLDIMALVRSYRAWCAEKGFTPADLDSILDQTEQLCRKIDVKIEPGDNQRVYVHGVKIEAPTPVQA
jgi:hypothetical protein